MTVRIPTWCLWAAGGIILALVAFAIGRGCSFTTTSTGGENPASPDVQQGAPRETALSCDDEAARDAINASIRKFGDPRGTLSDRRTGGLRKTVHVTVLGCADLTSDGADEMVAAADGVGAGANHPVNWYVFSPKNGDWKQVLHREQPMPEIEISNGVVTETTGVFRRSDAMCCPSAKRRGVIRFRQGRFVYIPESNIPNDLTVRLDPRTRQISSFGPLDAFSATGGDFRQVFGEPNFVSRPYSETCENHWSDLGLKVSFVDLGGGNPCLGLIGSVVLKGDEARHAGWRGPDGLTTGIRMTQLRRRFPALKRASYPDPDEDAVGWTLVDHFSPIGDPGQVPTVNAYISGERVARIDYFVGAGGD